MEGTGEGKGGRYFLSCVGYNIISIPPLGSELVLKFYLLFCIQKTSTRYD